MDKRIFASWWINIWSHKVCQPRWPGLLYFCRYFLFVCLSDAWVPQDHKLSLGERETGGPEVLGSCVHPSYKKTPRSLENKGRLNKNNNKNDKCAVSWSKIPNVFSFFLTNTYWEKKNYIWQTRRRVKSKTMQAWPSIVLRSTEIITFDNLGLFYWHHICLWRTSG